MASEIQAGALLRDAQAFEAAGDRPQAEAAFQAIYQQGGLSPAVLMAWAGLRQRAGDLHGAAAMLRQCATSGGGPASLIALAGVLIDLGDLAQAEATLGMVGARGGVEATYQQGRLAAARGDGARAAALLRAASRADHRHEGSRLDLADVLLRLGKPDDAIAVLMALLARKPNHQPALRKLGWLHGNQRRFHDALACFDKLEATGADVAAEIAQVAIGLMHIGDWSKREALRERMDARARVPRPFRANPYALLAAIDDPAAHLRFARRIADAVRESRGAVAGIPLRPARGADRIAIGYLCGDLNYHATSLLLAGVIEAHDRARFAVTAYDYSPEDGSAVRARTVAAFERFVSVGALSAHDTAARIASDRIDILVDLSGYTDRPRSEVLALRPAPVQVNFLGFVASQGAEWIDYVIADDIVVPLDQQTNWPERILHMPVTCYPSDQSRPLPEPDRDRAAHGLQTGAFVFTCFNNPYKISPEIFHCWMRLLDAVPNSVLWLFEGNEFIARNLRGHAKDAGIAPARLVFAPPVDLPLHIARHGCADLFLDTSPYGAHTTGIDALWAGVPMVTCPGRSFASRVGASLLRAVGLSELTASSLEDYTAIAIALASDPVRLAALRARLIAARDTSVLFDAPRFARDLEALFTKIATRE